MLDKKYVLEEFHQFLNNWEEIVFTENNIAKIRNLENLASQARINSHVDGVTTETYIVKSYDKTAKIRLKLYIPTKNNNSNKPAILYAHGGGFIFGNVENRDQRHKQLCKNFGIIIVGVEYRLAPEHQYPIPQEDCYHALKWLFENAPTLGINPNKIMLWGDSAGGGLMASVSMMARDRKEFSIAHQFLIYPMIDDRTCLKSFANPYIGKFIWNNVHNNYAWNAILGMKPNSDNISEYAAPARATNFDKIPSTFIAVGGIDLFIEENISFATNLIKNDITTELHIYPKCFHAFDMVLNSQTANEFYRDFDNALKKAINE